MTRFAKLFALTLVTAFVPLVASAETGGGAGASWGPALGAGIAFGFAALGCGIGAVACKISSLY